MQVVLEGEEACLSVLGRVARRRRKRGYVLLDGGRGFGLAHRESAAP